VKKRASGIQRRALHSVKESSVGTALVIYHVYRFRRRILPGALLSVFQIWFKHLYSLVFYHFQQYEKRMPVDLTLSREITEFLSEFIGTMLFSFFGGLTGVYTTGGAWAALGNAIALAVLVYCTAAVSGGKLNPVVSIALFTLNANPFGVALMKLFFEIGAQITGAIAGGALVRKLAFGVAGATPGCFLPPPGTPQDVVFGMETLSTFLLVITVLSTAVDESGNARFAVVAPLAIGLSLFVAASSVGHWTGGSLNPARFLGANVTGACGSEKYKYAGSYVGGEILGAVLAAFLHWLIRAHIDCECLLLIFIFRSTNALSHFGPCTGRLCASCTAFALARRRRWPLWARRRATAPTCCKRRAHVNTTHDHVKRNDFLCRMTCHCTPLPPPATWLVRQKPNGRSFVYTMKGRIDLIIGCMFAGKSTELLRRMERNKLAGRTCLLIRPMCDTRDFFTHNRVTEHALFVQTLEDAEKRVQHVDVVGIDEIQFFENVDLVDTWANAGKIVICAGLSATYTRKPWQSVSHLVAIAETITRLSAVCKRCGADGEFTHRFVTDDKELIGGAEAYDALCRTCFKEKPPGVI
jgi:thymidine kinase/glycerol uptake facilitator-like aquaporin